MQPIRWSGLLIEHSLKFSSSGDCLLPVNGDFMNVNVLFEYRRVGVVYLESKYVHNLWGIPHLWGMASCQVVNFVHLFPPAQCCAVSPL